MANKLEIEKVTCPNCNGLGEKTVWRGNHPVLHKERICYTCMGEGKVTKEEAEAFLKEN